MATVTPDFLNTTTTLTASAAAYVTAGANTKVMVKKAVFTNTDTVARTITVYRVPSGGSAATGNKMIDAYSLSPKQTYEATSLGNLVLGPGASLHALADSAAVVNIFVSGLTL